MEGHPSCLFHLTAEYQYLAEAQAACRAVDPRAKVLTFQVRTHDMVA